MRSLLVVAALVLSAAPASSQIVRVSLSTAGTEANGPSGPPSISGTGRYVVFASTATNLVAGDTNGVSDIFLRDRDTDADGVFDEAVAVATTRLSVAPGGAEANGASTSPVITPDGRYVAFVSLADNLVAGGNGGTAQAYRVDRSSGAVVLISQDPAGAPGGVDPGGLAIADDGDVVAFFSSGNLDGSAVPFPPGVGVFVREVSANRTVRLTIIFPPTSAPPAFDRPTISADGMRVGYLMQFERFGPQLVGVVVDRAAGTEQSFLIETLVGNGSMALSASGLDVVVRTSVELFRRAVDTRAETAHLGASANNTSFQAPVSPSVRYALTEEGGLYDFDFGRFTSLPFVPGGGDFSDDDRFLAVVSATSTLVAGDTNGVSDAFVVDLPDLLDADDDTMDDRWEAIFGVTDPGADPDGDGQTNAQEEDAGTHPNGQVRRFLAEGATGAFFHTKVGLANPSLAQAATAVLTFDRGDGTRVRRPLAIPAGRSAAVDLGAVTGLEFSDVSTTVESDRFLGVQRSMTWGTPASVYGSHAETATASPATTWFLAEGSTVLGFDLFYLLQNPQATTTHATVRFLLPSGTTISKIYDLAPGSRTTIYVNQIVGLEETDVSGDISADAPIVVERAMYRSTPTEPFALGTDSMGVTAPATSWFLAEGATGSFFDLYVLIANPGNSDAVVRADYLRPDGSVVTQSYTVRAHSRHSVYVDAITGLEATSVATTLTSTNGVPIVAERAMYWPGGFFDYYEGHSSAGSTTTALAWVVAGTEHGGPTSAQTFVLIANTENRPGEATVTGLPDFQTGGPAPATLVLALPPSSRTTIPLTTSTPGRFGVLVQSTGASPVQIVVESAVYRSGGILWSAGENALGTPVP
jgi:WD40 repeat protein